VIAVATAYAVATAFIGNVPTSASGLVKSDVCGLFEISEHADSRDEDRDDLRQAMKERAVTQYARNCYWDNTVSSPEQCNFFDHAVMPHSLEKHIECPFKDTDFCDNRLGAVRFSTGGSKKTTRVKANLIGLNSQQPPKFSRVTTCTPLNTIRPPKDYITRLTPPESDNPRFGYRLGSVAGDLFENDTYTFQTRGWSFNWALPGYAIRFDGINPSQELY
jgi:hypothetical protein